MKEKNFFFENYGIKFPPKNKNKKEKNHHGKFSKNKNKLKE